MIKASVIIPVHNAEKTIRRCVESLIFGTERDIELILVEDHSDDGSWELCRMLEQEFPRVRAFRNIDGKRVSSTRNLGLKKAEGKYVFFVDSDDWVSGRFVESLLEAAAENQSSLALCGFQYLDIPLNERTFYLLKDHGEKAVLPRREFFTLYGAVLLQQVTNKAFLRSVIAENNLRFDEELSIGEDFQFLIDYIVAAGIEECRIVNLPLYYYIHANNSSLMSKFGIAENTYDFERLEQLYHLCGEGDPKVGDQYRQAVRSLRSNYVYRICHASEMARAEKLKRIESLVHEGQAKKIYRKQQALIWKERLWHLKKRLEKLPGRISGKLFRMKRSRMVRKLKNTAVFENVSVISQNCIGGVFYHDMGRQFLSPTINLYFREPDFVRFACRLEYYMAQRLKMEWDEEYPVGYLEDVQVRFMHYASCTEAEKAWKRRKDRIRWDRILILASDMEGFDDACYEKWLEIPYPKVLFTAKKRTADGCVFFPEYEGRACVPDLIPRREFYRDGVLLNTVNKFYKEK